MALLSASLNGEVPKDFVIDDVDWMQLKEEATNQTVNGQIWGVIEANSTLSNSLSIADKMTWFYV